MPNFNFYDEKATPVAADVVLIGDSEDGGKTKQSSATAIAATIPDASTTVKGKVALATDLEHVTGTEALKAATPAGLTARLAAPGEIGGTTPAPRISATILDTAIAAAGVTLSGTTLAADGTDATIDINITPKGTGEVNLPKVDIDAGAIDATTVGSTTPAAGAFTTLKQTTGAALGAIPVSDAAGALTLTASTGTGAPVRATSPTLVTPTLGVASATSVNKVAITAPATGSTITVAEGKTLTASNTLTLTGTDATSHKFPAVAGTVEASAVVEVNATRDLATIRNLTLDGDLTIPGYLEAPADAGAIVAFNLPITSALAGVEQSFSFQLDSTTVLKVYGESNGAGGLQNAKVVIVGDQQQTAVLNAATSNEVAFQLNYTTNKATSGNDTGLEINFTDTASPGTSLPLNINIGGSSVFKVGLSGALVTVGGATFGNVVTNWENPGSTGAYSWRPTIQNTGSQTGLKLTPTYNQASGTAANTDILVNRTETAVGSGVQNLIDLQVAGVSKFRGDNKGLVYSNVAEDTDSDTDDVLVTTIPNTVYGMLIVRESTGTEACQYLLAGGTIEKTGADATFTVTKDNAATYNVYFETNVIKIQNKVGDNKNIRCGFFGV